MGRGYRGSQHTSKTVNGEYRTGDLFRAKPKFAVISMEENLSANAIDLTKGLLDQGIKNVRFYDDLSQHPAIQQKVAQQNNNRGVGAATYPDRTTKMMARQVGQPKQPRIMANMETQTTNNLLPGRHSIVDSSVEKVEAAATQPIFETQDLPSLDFMRNLQGLMGQNFQNMQNGMTLPLLGVGTPTVGLPTKKSQNSNDGFALPYPFQQVDMTESPPTSKKPRTTKQANQPKRVPHPLTSRVETVPLAQSNELLASAQLLVTLTAMQNLIQTPAITPTLNPMFNITNEAKTQISASLPTPFHLPIAPYNPARLLPSLLARSTPTSSRSSSSGSSTPRSTPKPIPRNTPVKIKHFPEEFLKCTRCKENVLISNYSLMVKHAKTHLRIKSFQCTDCDFASDCWESITRHMQFRHKKRNPVPINNDLENHPDFKAMVDDLFPRYREQLEILRVTQMLKNQNYKKPNNNEPPNMQVNGIIEKEFKEEGIGSRKRKMVVVLQSKISYRCHECPNNRQIETFPGLELHSDQDLVNHLRLCHSEKCLLYKCEKCGWKNAKEWVVRCHISYNHMEDASKIKVTETRRPDWRAILPKFYPELIEKNIIKVDEEVEELMKLANDRTHKNRLRHYWTELKADLDEVDDLLKIETSDGDKHQISSGGIFGEYSIDQLLKIASSENTGATVIPEDQ